MLTDVKKLKYCGRNVKIFSMAKIIHPELVEIGEGTQIDDFTFINGGKGTQIGKYNHVASFVSVVGGGELITGDYVGIATGSRIITGTHHYGQGQRISPLIPEEDQCVIRGKIILEKDVFVGANVIIHPNVTIGEGAIVGSGSLVTKDIKPWTINVGVPARVKGNRPKINE
ncbi:MAG: acyltransferase [Candidatus Bathyarchaeia archaeon]